jgi:hypothetical protein
LSAAIRDNTDLNATTISALTHGTLPESDLSQWVNHLYQSAHTAMTVVLPSRVTDMSVYQKQGWLTAGSIYWQLSQNVGSESYSPTLGPLIMG